MTWQFDIDNPDAARLWSKAAEEAAAKPSFFWVPGPPRLTRWQRLCAWVLRLLGRAPVEDAEPVAVGTVYGIQKAILTVAPPNSYLDEPPPGWKP